MKFCYNMSFTLLNAKGLNPSYKTDLDILDSFGIKKLSLMTEEIWYV